jgi:hypothetical protein
MSRRTVVPLALLPRGDQNDLRQLVRAIVRLNPAVGDGTNLIFNSSGYPDEIRATWNLGVRFGYITPRVRYLVMKWLRIANGRTAGEIFNAITYGRWTRPAMTNPYYISAIRNGRNRRNQDYIRALRTGRISRRGGRRGRGRGR